MSDGMNGTPVLPGTSSFASSPFEIAADARTGHTTASNGAQSLVLLDVDGRVFRRRAVVNFTRMVEWAVAELDGVRVYFDGQRVVVTRKDIYPT